YNRTSIDSISTRSHPPQTLIPTPRAAEEHDAVVETKRHSNRNTAPVSLPAPHPTLGSFADSSASASKEQACLSKFDNELEDLLGAQTAREKESKRVREEILELLNTPTAKERYLSERFRSQGGSQVQQFCAQGTRVECSKYKMRTGDRQKCTKLHFRKIIHPHTDESLGDCSFLNTCFHVDTCKYVHYTIDYTDSTASTLAQLQSTPTTQSNLNSIPRTAPSKGLTPNGSSVVDPDASQTAESNETSVTMYPPQWINCDIRLLNMSILGKFAVIMADPPWDIHMELPYGTMSDDEMRRLDIPCLQDDGYIFLWVTGRAMELGRDCLRLWGYQRVDEIIWVKTNQLQRLIRTGRTGHWLNHGKEHCLVGVKGNPQGVNRGLDCDVIVSEVRETSHKPDEIYGIIERLSPGTRKLELFGRPHNLQPYWITLGNQLDGTFLVDPAVVERFKKHYPNGLDMKGS
ncbi:Methyltransferase like 3, partial [Paragonimus heterotremus]